MYSLFSTEKLVKISMPNNNNAPFLTEKEEAILTLLSQRKKAYGLELVEASCGILKKGGIYPVLSRMKDCGWVDSWIEEAEKGHKGPPRRLYKLTARGSNILSAWRKWVATATEKAS